MDLLCTATLSPATRPLCRAASLADHTVLSNMHPDMSPNSQRHVPQAADHAVAAPPHGPAVILPVDTGRKPRRSAAATASGRARAQACRVAPAREAPQADRAAACAEQLVARQSRSAARLERRRQAAEAAACRREERNDAIRLARIQSRLMLVCD